MTLLYVCVFQYHIVLYAFRAYSSSTPLCNSSRELRMAQGFKTSKPIRSNILPTSRPHLLHLPKQHHQSGTKLVYEGHSHRNSLTPIKFAPMGISYLANHYCGSQHSQLVKTADAFFLTAAYGTFWDYES